MLRNEWRVLFHLGIFGQMTASEIGARAQMHKTKISRAVQRLEDRRYLTRARVAEDRRAEYLTLTQAGARVYRDLKSIAQEYDAALTDGMTDGEAAMLRGLLERLARRA